MENLNDTTTNKYYHKKFDSILIFVNYRHKKFDSLRKGVNNTLIINKRSGSNSTAFDSKGANGSIPQAPRAANSSVNGKRKRKDVDKENTLVISHVTADDDNENTEPPTENGAKAKRRRSSTISTPRSTSTSVEGKEATKASAFGAIKSRLRILPVNSRFNLIRNHIRTVK